MKNPWIYVGVGAVILFGGAFWYAGVAAEKNNDGVEVVSHIKGNREATVTLVEYADLQCPACAAFQPAINEAMTLYGDSISFEFKHFPLPIHRFAEDAALAAEAAGQQDKFFEYHDLLFTNQTEWSGSPNPPAFFLKYAEDLELDMESFRRHMNSSVLRGRVQEQFNEARDLGLTGTPTFFLNGNRMQITTFQDFLDQIGAAVTGETPEGAVAPVVESDVRFGI
jgi:protein-disulfide isomerase